MNPAQLLNPKAFAKEKAAKAKAKAAKRTPNYGMSTSHRLFAGRSCHVLISLSPFTRLRLIV